LASSNIFDRRPSGQKYMAVSPLTSQPVSITHNIRYSIIRNKAGLNFGVNETNLADPRTIKTLGQLFGAAGIDSSQYATFYGYNFDEEITDRTVEVLNEQDVYFVHRGLINLPPHLLIR
jgi:hypothetical protein